MLLKSLSEYLLSCWCYLSLFYYIVLLIGLGGLLGNSPIRLAVIRLG